MWLLPSLPALLFLLLLLLNCVVDKMKDKGKEQPNNKRRRPSKKRTTVSTEEEAKDPSTKKSSIVSNMARMSPKRTPKKRTVSSTTSTTSTIVSGGKNSGKRETKATKKKVEKEPRMKIIRKKCVVKSDVNWKKKYKEEGTNVREELNRLEKEHKAHRKRGDCRTNWEKCQQCHDYRERLKGLYAIGEDYDVMWRIDDQLLEFDEIYEKTFESWRKVTKKDKQWLGRRTFKTGNLELPVEFTQSEKREEDTQEEEDNTQRDEEEEPASSCRPEKKEPDEGGGGGFDDGQEISGMSLR